MRREKKRADILNVGPLEIGAAWFLERLQRGVRLRSLEGVLDHLENRHAFRCRWTADSLTEILRRVEIMDRVFGEEELPYLCDASTMLGIERHGGVIPWDTEVKFWVEGRELDRMRGLSGRFAERGLLLRETETGFRLKLCGAGEHGCERGSDEGGIRIRLWDRAGEEVAIRGTIERYPHRHLFPLRRAPFHHLSLPVPHDSRAILTHRYGPHFMTQVFSPATPKRGEKIERPEPVLSRYPFPRWKSVLRARLMPERQLCEMLFRTGVAFLQACGVEYWADFGTLLGSYRGGTLLRHDYDVDFGLLEEAMPALLKQAHLLDPDYKLVDRSYRHNGPRWEIVHRKFGGHCDLYTYRRLEDGRLRICLGDAWHGTLDARDIPKEMIYPLHFAEINGVRVPHPHRTGDYLLHRYGYLDHPAVLMGDGSGHYRPMEEQKSPLNGVE